MRFRLPSLGTLMQDALKNGTNISRIQVSQSDGARIRRAEAAGGHDAGLRMVLLILREKNHERKRMSEGT